VDEKEIDAALKKVLLLDEESIADWYFNETSLSDFIPLKCISWWYIACILHVVDCILYVYDCILHVFDCILHVFDCILYVYNCILHVFACNIHVSLGIW